MTDNGMDSASRLYFSTKNECQGQVLKCNKSSYIHWFPSNKMMHASFQNGGHSLRMHLLSIECKFARLCWQYALHILNLASATGWHYKQKLDNQQWEPTGFMKHLVAQISGGSSPLAPAPTIQVSAVCHVPQWYIENCPKWCTHAQGLMEFCPITMHYA